MLIDFNKERLEQTLSDFYTATGVNIDILDETFQKLCDRSCSSNKYCSYIQSLDNGREKCLCSDEELLQRCKETKKAQFHVCHAGLIDVGVPIIHADNIIGYLILGQMKKTEDFFHYLKKNEAIPENAGSMKEYYDELVLFDEERITGIINIALMLAKYILLEKMLYSVTNDCVDRVVHYISENLSEPFSIKKLSSAVGYSSSEIYKSFHKYHNCTVGEYVTKSRIEHSCGLLLETDMLVEEISVKCGFSSAPYFSKKFKELMGMSPVKYRKRS